MHFVLDEMRDIIGNAIVNSLQWATLRIKLFAFAVIIKKKFGVVWHHSKNNVFNKLRKL